LKPTSSASGIGAAVHERAASHPVAGIQVQPREAFATAMLAASLDALVALDIAGRVVEWNQAAERTFGYSRDEAIGACVAELIIPPEERDEHRRRIRRMFADPGSSMLGRRYERRMIRAGGEVFRVELTVTRAEGPEPILVACIRDITERLAKEAAQTAEAARRQELVERLEQAEARYRELIERLPVVSYLAEYGPKGRWLYVSPQIEALLGFAPPEWLNDPELWWNRVHPDDRERIAEEEERCARTLERLSVEYRMIAKDGRVVWIRDEGSLGRPVDGGTVRVEGVLTDVSERRRAEDKLRHRAYHDDLTDLPNRRFFEDELRARRRDPGFAGAVAIIDVDDLKYVNDSLGHAAGDALLKTVASSLQSSLRGDEFLARFGGDEFTLLLPTSDPDLIRERLAEFVQVVRARRAPTPARVSVGAAPFEAGSDSSDEALVVAADMALHEAKERGGDRYLVSAGITRDRLAWVGNVRAAIDDDRLLLHGQPIYDLASGELLASELLVRMTDRDGTLLSPAAFLPTAERFGLITEIDRWVAERAAELAADGRSVMINLSARSIAAPEFTEGFAAALERTGADPRDIVFEITETAAATASDDLQRFGARVERMGCALAIDDFGTGFGSLTYLKHMPIRYLKIDMEFVGGVTESAADRAIVGSITTIAKSLGMRTIAEGVEDEATLQRLREIGVDYVQGYHLGRPGEID
jgi:diguanylate cyclase (GGDEF)-like protein/PAS domain S-box-containing protein